MCSRGLFPQGLKSLSPHRLKTLTGTHFTKRAHCRKSQNHVSGRLGTVWVRVCLWVRASLHMQPCTHVFICIFIHAVCAFHWIITSICRAIHALVAIKAQRSVCEYLRFCFSLFVVAMWECEVCVQIIKPWGLSIKRQFRIHTPQAMRERSAKTLYLKEAKFMTVRVGVRILPCIWMKCIHTGQCVMPCTYCSYNIL